MHSDTPRSDSVLESNRRLAVENLKRCPVCGTVNAKLNHECFVCRWHGEFVTDAQAVEEGLMEVLEQCPELVDCILYLPRKSTAVESAFEWLRQRRRKSLDFEA